MSIGRWGRVALAALAVGLTGCMESTTVLSLRKDGSGTIRMTQYVSPQTEQKVAQAEFAMHTMMATMAKAFKGRSGEHAQMPEPEKTDFLAAHAKKMARIYGPGVALTSYAAVTNAAGWNGYDASYTFADVNAVTIEIGNMDFLDSESEKDEEGIKWQYGFAYTPGETGRLRIEPRIQRAASDGDPEEGDLHPNAQRMLEGMRLTFRIRVDGKILKTNARHASPGDTDAVILDVPMDKVLADAQARKWFVAGAPVDSTKLDTLQRLGARMDEDNKILDIRFR
ncbi:MAG: hypothetical protein JXR37_26370 [Kiritimatiellae bacterium]|nr:hypothetical protein [Kiritimatiellia bacterium]